MQVTEVARTSWAHHAVCGERIRLGNEVVDFAPLLEWYPTKLVSDLLDAIARCYQRTTIKYPGQQSRSLRNFLLWVASHPKDQSCSAQAETMHQSLSQSSIVDVAVFETCVHAFVEALRDTSDTSIIRTAKIGTRRSHIEHLGMALRAISSEGFWPTLGRLNIGVGMRTSGDNYPSFGELRRTIRSAVMQQPRTSPDTSISKIMQLNQERLGALRRLLVVEFEAGWSEYQRGQARRARRDLPSLAMLRKGVRALNGKYARSNFRLADHPDIERCFPASDPEFRVSALLKFLAEERLGCIEVTSGGRDWERLIGDCGGATALQVQLGGSGRAMAAAHGIVLIDTGFNIQPCDDLLAQPVLMSAQKGRYTLSTVTSQKMRAGGKIVPAVLVEYEKAVPASSPENQIGTLTVIERWREMSQLYRERASTQNPGLAKFLWLRPTGQNFSTVGLAPSNYAWWRTLDPIFAQDPTLAGLRITRKSIRTTVLQLRAANSGLSVSAVATAASHSSEAVAIRSYLNRGWFKSEMDGLIRTFQNHLEAAVITDTKLAVKLGLTSEELGDRRAAAVENGLGFSCLNPYTGHAPGSARGELCSSIEHCGKCELLEFRPTPAALKDLVLTERSLADVEGEFSSRNPARWATTWMVLLAVTRATISRLMEGHHSKALQAAELDIDDALRCGTVKLRSVY